MKSRYSFEDCGTPMLKISWRRGKQYTSPITLGRRHKYKDTCYIWSPTGLASLLYGQPSEFAHLLWLDMAEVGYFVLDGLVDGLLRPADNEVRTEAQPPQLPDAGLRGFGLVLASAGGLRHQRDVHTAKIVPLRGKEFKRQI